MPWTYYIDGYNVVYRSPALHRFLAAEDFQAARQALVEKVGRLCAVDGSEATIVFDGQGRVVQLAPPDEGPPGVEVIYSTDGQSADIVIERLVYLAADRNRIVVVTADREIREVCLALGALVMAPDNFLAAVHESRDGLAQILEQLRRAHPPHRVEDHLDACAREHLDELRDKLPEQQVQAPAKQPCPSERTQVPPPPPLDPARAADTLRNRIGIRALERLRALHRELSAKRARKQRQRAPATEAPMPPPVDTPEPTYVSGQAEGSLDKVARDRLEKIRTALAKPEKRKKAAPTRKRKKPKPPAREHPPPTYTSGRGQAGLDDATRKRLRKLRDELSE